MHDFYFSILQILSKSKNSSLCLNNKAIHYLDTQKSQRNFRSAGINFKIRYNFLHEKCSSLVNFAEKISKHTVP